MQKDNLLVPAIAANYRSYYMYNISFLSSQPLLLVDENIGSIYLHLYKNADDDAPTT